MKTSAFLQNVRRPLLALAGATLIGLPAISSAADKEPVYENVIELSSGYTLQSGDRANFQKYFQQRKEGYLGIESLRYSSQLDDATALKLRGQALAGNGDYLLDLTIERDEVGYVKLGYKQFRTYYDGSGGVWPVNGLRFKLYDEDMHVDRGNLWVEAGLNRPDQPSFVIRYDLFTRKGTKDSTSWMDSGLPVSAAATRYIVPTFLKLDEKRHVIDGQISRRQEKSQWAIGLRLDKGELDNGRYSRRRPLESVDRYVTAREGQNFDTSQFRGMVAVELSDQVKVTTSAARTNFDTELSGSRIFGTSYDASYTSNYPTRQQRDEGFFSLPGMHLGESEMTQTIANIQVLYRPLEHLAVIPSLRFEKTDWHNIVEFEETNFGSGPAFAPINDEVEADSEKSWKTYSYALEARYTAIENMSFNLKGELTSSDGTLAETRILEPGTVLQAISVDRDTELKRDTQKIALTANWYPTPGHAIAAQVYFKARQNDFDAIRDTTPNTITSSDRYPAYIANQDFETNDFNVRYSWRITPSLRSVTRYDYSKTTINSQEVGLAFGESMANTQSVIAQSFTWSVTPQWYVQASLNYVDDKLTTPAVYATGAAANLVSESKGNYTSWNVASGYALDDASDLYVDYMTYSTRDNYVNNSAVSVPYGSDNTLQVVSATYNRRLDRRTSIGLKYSYAKNEDNVSLGASDYEAHMVQAKISYRF